MYLMRASIRLNYVQWLRLVRQWLSQHCCPFAANQLPFVFVFFFSFCCLLALQWFRLPLFAVRFSWKIEFISIHLFVYWIFYIRSNSFSFRYSMRMDSVFVFFPLARHFFVTSFRSVHAYVS